MKDIATNKAEDERLAAQDVLGGPVKSKASAIGGPGQPKSTRNLVKRLATKAMKAGHSVSEEQKKPKIPRVGEMEKALEEEQIDNTAQKTTQHRRHHTTGDNTAQKTPHHRRQHSTEDTSPQ